MLEAPTEEVGVSGLDGIEGFADSVLVSDALGSFLGFCFLAGLLGEEEGLFLKHLGREHGNKGDSCGSGDAYHDGNNPAEFLHEDTHHAGQHGEGDEYGHKHKGGGDNGGPYLVGGTDSRFAWRFTAFYVFGDVLQHHNGVVHNHTDGNGERSQ